ELPLVVDGQRRVVGEALRLVDRFPARGGSDPGGGDLVIDAPADILRPGLPAIGPPGVLIRLLVEAPENIDKAQRVEYAGEPGAFLRQEAGVPLIRPPVAQVDLLVRDIPVAAQDDLVAAAAQPPQVLEEVFEEAELRVLPVRARGARGQIQRSHPQPAEAPLDVAALGVELAAPEAALDLVGRPAAIEADAAVAFLLGEGVAALERLQATQPGVDVGLLALHLLQAHDVGALRREPAEQAFLRG